MLIQSYNDVGGRPELFGMSAVLIVIGLSLIALTPAKRPVELAAASNV